MPDTEPSAANGPASPPGESRFRRWSRPSGMQVVMAILIGSLAFAMTAQIGQDDATDYTSVRGVELVELLKSIDAANERLGTQIEDPTQTRDDLLSSSRRSESAEEQARQRSDQLAILAGSAGATGPGSARRAGSSRLRIHASPTGVRTGVSDPASAWNAAAASDPSHSTTR